jgi:quinol monooxygenase YgiN
MNVWVKNLNEVAVNMIIVTGSFIAKEAQLDTALALSLAHVQRSRLEDGCLMFSVNIDAENSNRMVFLEEWRDMAALKTHFKVPECMAFASRLNELAESVAPLNIYEATVLSG